MSELSDDDVVNRFHQILSRMVSYRTDASLFPSAMKLVDKSGEAPLRRFGSWTISDCTILIQALIVQITDWFVSW